MLFSSRPSRLLIFAVAASICWIIIHSYGQGALSGVPVLPLTPNQDLSSPLISKPSPAPVATQPETQKPNPAPVPIAAPAPAPAPAPAKEVASVHRIEQLWEQAKAKQASLLANQSKTLEDARREYQRRYEIPPPPGYDEWYAYATNHDSQIIDDFDDLMANLRPFRSYQEAGCQFEDNKTPLPAMLPVCIINKTIDTGHPSAYDTKQIAVPFKDFVSDFQEALPDMCFYINTFDEPRHAIPAKRLNNLLSPDVRLSCEKHEFKNFKREDVWAEVIVPCSEDSPARDPTAPFLNSTSALVEDWFKATDLCSFNEAPPAGMLRCPENLSVTSAARPVLSAASLSTFSDIMFPTLWRWRFDSKVGAAWAKTDDSTPWSEKANLVGWRGSSNGGYAWSDNWRQFQRHRMVALANGASPPPPYHVQSTERLQSWLDVQFTNILNCEPETCEVMKKELPVVESQKLSDTFKNKIVLDMDGHGLSGRFYMLLQSDSAVMKQGIVREWHDSRLLPWLHYIPLSMGMTELEDMLEYLFGEGDHILASIAAESKAWTDQALRREDMRIYMYRLLIELGRKTF